MRRSVERQTSKYLSQVIAAVLVLAATGLVGCARGSARDWAQTSPVLSPEANANVLNLGVAES